jgi:hypothetical protein
MGVASGGEFPAEGRGGPSPAPSGSHHSLKCSRLAARPSRSSGSGSSGRLVSVFIANPIHCGLRIHASTYPKRKEGKPEALAGWFSDMYRADARAT